LGEGWAGWRRGDTVAWRYNKARNSERLARSIARHRCALTVAMAGAGALCALRTGLYARSGMLPVGNIFSSLGISARRNNATMCCALRRSAATP